MWLVNYNSIGKLKLEELGLIVAKISFLKRVPLSLIHE